MKSTARTFLWRYSLPALSTAALMLAAPLGAEEPTWWEKLLFNPVERTARGIEAFEGDAAAQAAEPLETALRLDSDDPVARYNAGTGRLATQPEQAIPLLESASQAGGELASRAHYNLGNARLGSQDFQGAIEAYKSSLRADPSLEDAKFNLELAQRLLQEQQQEQEQQQDGDQEQDQNGNQQQEQQQDGDQEQQEQQDQEQQQGDQEQQQDGDQEQNQDGDQEQQEQQDQEQQQGDQEQQQGDPRQEQQQEQQSRLPQFKDVPDMTAEEAAAILEAVENQERERRRQEALEAAQENASGKKDW